jgi:hypothetical protein
MEFCILLRMRLNQNIHKGDWPRGGGEGGGEAGGFAGFCALVLPCLAQCIGQRHEASAG